MSLSVLSLGAAALAGAGLGGAYLGLLWMAVDRLPQARRGVAVFVGLALARAVLVLGALGAAAALGVQVAEIGAALLGFVAVRAAATRLAGRAREDEPTWK